MAKNTGDGFRRGAVTGRTQVERPDGHWQKRDETTGQLMAMKQSPGPWKGVAKDQTAATLHARRRIGISRPPCRSAAGSA